MAVSLDKLREIEDAYMEAMRKLQEAESAYWEAARPFLDRMDEVKRRVEDVALFPEESVLQQMFFNFLAYPTSEDKDKWLEMVDPEGRVAFRLPEEMLDLQGDGVSVSTDYAFDKEYPLSFFINCWYERTDEEGIVEEVRAGAHLLWKPEDNRFELIVAEVELLDGAEIEGVVEGPYMPRWVYERFLRG